MKTDEEYVAFLERFYEYFFQNENVENNTNNRSR